MHLNKLLPYIISIFSIIFILSLNTFLYLKLSNESTIFIDVYIGIGLLNITILSLFFYMIAIKKNQVTKIETSNNSSTNNHDFVANMTHELRTPLTGILGFVGILKETKLNEEQQEFVQTIESSSNNLLSLVNDILDYSKVSVGKVELEKHSFDLLTNIENSIEGYITKSAEKYIELGLYIDPTLPTNLIGDSSKISQVLLNLLSNAIKFTPEHGVVSISIVKIKENINEISILFSVRDSGIGITPKQREKIFEAFSQADSSTTREYGGTGLGLNISRNFVSLMGGELEITSKKNQGTTFSFTLKLKKETSIQERVHQNLQHKNIAYVIPKEDESYKKIDENLEKYIHLTGAKYKTYYQDEIFKLKEEELPDILYINHRYSLEEGLLDRYLALSTKVILITCADIENITMLYEKSISNFIFKPISYSKTMQSLVIKEKNTKEEKQILNNVSQNILLVEDNLINQKLMQKLLLNMNITLANNGKEAFELYKKNKYNMILMDIQMPIMSGIEATRKIIEYEKELGLKHTPIIAVTANTSNEQKEVYLDAGMDDYLAKPINLQKLKSILEKYSNKKTEQKKSILLYKDNTLIAKIHTSILKRLGYQVNVCSKKEMFINNFTNKTYSMILFDTDNFDKNEQTSFICNLAKNSTVPSFAFTNNSLYESSSTLISPDIYGKELQSRLEELEKII